MLQIIKKIIPAAIFKKLQPAYHFLLGWLAAVLTGHPSNKLIVIGITGTTGKTTSTYLIAKTLEAAGFRVGFTSTAIFSDGKNEWLNNKKMTMVGRMFTQKMLSRMVKNKCHYAIIETTSEGVRQFRHRFINYDILVFTGLYPEHIDSHGSFANYKKAKGDLFKHLKRCKTKYSNEQKEVCPCQSGLRKIELNRVRKIIIANGDDQLVDYFINHWSEGKFVYLREKDGKTPQKKDLPNKTEILSYGQVLATAKGTSFKVDCQNQSEKISLKILGEFNSTNSMNAVGVAFSQDIKLATIKEGLEKISGIAGRLEQIESGQDFTVIVDYAFEPGALKKLYETIKILPHNKIIHVLGSTGGGRDVGRRPQLGKLAGENAEIVIVTNEDPYDDDPQLIIDQVAVGVEHVGKKLNQNLFKIMDRRQAIAKAFSLAKTRDIVLITGKGSEQAIVVAGDKKIPWDDRQVAREELKKIIVDKS